ncbi:MAG: glycosyltransferase [Subdoligranulum sp.]|nr:glycosyltransferase [Subdoligranulum sp.]
MMDVLLLCGYFEPKHQQEISEKTKTWVENAANTFQQRLIAGLKKQDINLQVVSAPFIGPWPTAYEDKAFKGFKAGESTENIQYVPFNNIWGYRNISRTAALKKSVKEFVRHTKAEKKAIIVYCPHTPFLEAAVYGKQLDPSIHIHMVVPDLPQYMNLSKKAHPVYDFFKKIDIHKMEKLIAHVDSFMLLTEYMAEKLQVGKRPYIVVEGITDKQQAALNKRENHGKKVAYAGKLVEAFGAKRLIEAFELIDDPGASLHICGGGELKPYVEEMCKKDSRIHYYGEVSAEKANEILQQADVLVNPRQNDDEYTKYSFPSKNIEYLMTGNAVVAYMLDGMPEIYKKLFQIPKSDSTQDLAQAICCAMTTEPQIKSTNEYIGNKLYFGAVAKQIIEIINLKERL